MSDLEIRYDSQVVWRKNDRITDVINCQNDKSETDLYDVFDIYWMKFYLNEKHRLYETKAWRMTHDALRNVDRIRE